MDIFILTLTVNAADSIAVISSIFGNDSDRSVTISTVWEWAVSGRAVLVQFFLTECNIYVHDGNNKKMCHSEGKIIYHGSRNYCGNKDYLYTSVWNSKDSVNVSIHFSMWRHLKPSWAYSTTTNISVKNIFRRFAPYRAVSISFTWLNNCRI